MLSIFSCTCWPSVCLLCRNAYLGLLPIFGLDSGSFKWRSELPPECQDRMLCQNMVLPVFSPQLHNLFCIIGATTGNESAMRYDTRWLHCVLGRKWTDSDNGEHHSLWERNPLLNPPAMPEVPSPRRTTGRNRPGGWMARKRELHHLSAPPERVSRGHEV